MRRWLAFWCALLLAPGAAQATWLEAETPHFRLYSEGSEESLRKFAVMLEDYDQILRLMTRTEKPASPVKLDIYLVGSNADLRKVRPVGPDAAGFYSSNPGYIAAFAMRGQGGGGLGREDVLFHEYAHHFMLQYYPGAYPPWYVEGFAEFMMTTNITDKLVEVGRFNDVRATWLVNGVTLPVAKILDGDIETLSRDQTAMFYAQSWLIVHWMFADERQTEAIRRYLLALAKGEDGPTAFQRETGMTYDAFARALNKYMNGRTNFIRFQRASDRAPVPVTIRALPASANELLLSRAAIMLGVPDARGASVLADVRRAAAKFPGDPFAVWTQAAAEVDFGDAGAGAVMLDALLAGGAKDAQTLFLRGYADLVAGRRQDDPAAKRARYDAARMWFAKAFRADATYVPALWAYVETRSLEPMAVNTLNVLLRAQELAPQVAVLRAQSAVALMRSHEFAAAAAMITPLASDPHGGRMTEFSRKLLAKARAGRFDDADLEPPAAEEE